MNVIENESTSGGKIFFSCLIGKIKITQPGFSAACAVWGRDKVSVTLSPPSGTLQSNTDQASGDERNSLYMTQAL